MEIMNKQITEILGPTMSSTITRTFALMEVAEEELQRAKDCAAPEDHDDIHAVFAYLCPSTVLAGKNEELYRKHVREMIARRMKGEDTRPGTDAEVLCALSDWSLEHPPGKDANALYFRLAVNLIPAALINDQPPDHVLTDETYPGAIDELLTKLRRRLAQEDRAS